MPVFIILFKTLGSLLFLIHPLGGFLSGVLQERFGKKLCMIFANMPSILGWTLLYFAHSSLLLYASTLLIGFGIGFGAGAVHAYVGEITEPRLRGSMASLTNTACLFGSMLTYILSSLFDWRTVALLSAFCPVICVSLITFVRDRYSCMLYSYSFHISVEVNFWCFFSLSVFRFQSLPFG